jgi:hypothetical protein
MIVLIPRGQPAMAARLCFTMNALAIGPASGSPVSSTRWKTRSGKTATPAGAIIKMDIEGGEWDSLLAASDELLASIPQIAMELHGFDDPKIVKVLRKLKRNFYLVNLHFNNWSCTSKAVPLPAWAYQVLWVNKRIGVFDAGVPIPAPMSPLNAPDSPTWPDCQLRAPGPAR